MKPYADNVVTFRVLLTGLDNAIARFRAAALTREAATAFQSLFWALNWVVALDDQARQHWAPEGKPLDWGWRNRIEGGDYVKAVRFARNRVHHQWADALLLTEGFSAPLVAPLVAHEWRWRPSADLPVGKDNQGELEYSELLANQPARVTLSDLTGPFKLLAELLEPTTAMRPEPATDAGTLGDM